MSPRRTQLGTLVGRRVRQARVNLGLRVADVAQRTGRSEQEIRRLELGSHTPTLPTLRRVAKALGCSARDLLPDNDE